MTTVQSILVIEDAPDVTQNLREGLEREGFHVRWASTCAKGEAADLFFDALPAACIAGRVERIVPYTVSGNRSLYITLDAVPTALVAGMTADAEIVIKQRDVVLHLPRSVGRPRADGSALVGV